VTACLFTDVFVAGKIHISEATKLHLDKVGGFITESRGPVNVKVGLTLLETSAKFTAS
jgi:hypothetical protein